MGVFDTFRKKKEATTMHREGDAVSYEPGGQATIVRGKTIPPGIRFHRRFRSRGKEKHQWYLSRQQESYC